MEMSVDDDVDVFRSDSAAGEICEQLRGLAIDAPPSSG
jgi:hypothetical protein